MRKCSGLGSAAELSRANALGLDARPGARGLGAVGLADLLGTCQRVFRGRPGEVLSEALVSTQGLLTM